MVKKDIIDLVLKNFLTSNRSPLFLTKPEYDGFPIDEFEPNREIYMSSAWFKNHWSWNKFSDTVEEMTNLDSDGKPKKYCALSIPYTLPLYHGILPLSKVENDLSAKDFSQVKWSMEMEALFFGQSEDAFYKYDDVVKQMKLSKIFIPDAKHLQVLNGKKAKYDFMLQDKEDGEIRVISADVAGTGEDNDVFICIRCIPESYGRQDNKKYYYKKEVVYIKHISMAHSEIKARMLKKLKEDFQADWIVIDTMGVSSNLYEACCKVTYDDKNDIEYPAWTAINDDKLDSIKLDENAEKIIYSVRASAQFNHDCANALKDNLISGQLILPMSREEAEAEYEEEIPWYNDLPTSDKTEMMLTFDEAYLTMIELTNLDAVWSDKGLVSIEKPAGGKVKRDRYSALSYNIWFCKELEKKNLNKGKKKKSSFNFNYTPQDYFSK